MMTRQQLLDPDPSLLESPSNWFARRDYLRAQRLAQRLDLQECQAVFLDQTVRSDARYRQRFFYPLASLALVVVILLLFVLTPAANVGWLAALLALCLFGLLIYTSSALMPACFDRTFFHYEQVHLYTNGFVALDARGRQQGARWDQLFDLRRGAHQGNDRFGRVYWNILRVAVAKRRKGQRAILEIMPQLPGNNEICARIERAYTAYWLPRFQERYAVGEVLDFDALLLHQEWLGKTTPGRRRYTASLPLELQPPSKKISSNPGMARGLITQNGGDAAVEWLRRNDVKAIHVDDRFILIRTIEPVSRDKQGRADRLWFRLDTLSLKNAAILKALLTEG